MGAIIVGVEIGYHCWSVEGRELSLSGRGYQCQDTAGRDYHCRAGDYRAWQEGGCHC